MKVIEPSFDIYPPYKPEEALKRVERIARVCYKSEDKITEDSYIKMVGNLVARQHWAMLEHASICLEVSPTVYRHLVEMVDCLARRGYRSYLRWSAEGALTGRCLVSGNLRAWLETGLAAAKAKVGVLSRYPEPVLAVLNSPWYRPVFDDKVFAIDQGSAWLAPDSLLARVCKVVPFEELDPIERKVHGDVSIRFTVDRGITHELVRHRPASFAQESTRYCNYTLGKFGGDIRFIKPYFFEEGTPAYFQWESGMAMAEHRYAAIMAAGGTPQQARTILPSSVAADIVVTTTVGEWEHIFNLRALGTTGAPHPQMVEVMLPCYYAMVDLYPELDSNGDV